MYNETNLDLGQHYLEPIKVIKGCPPLLHNQFSAPRTLLPSVLNICSMRKQTDEQKEMLPIK